MIIYLILFGLLIYAIYSDWRDFNQTSGTQNIKTLNTPLKYDAFLQLIDSTYHLKNIVLWRQSYIISFAAAIILSLVINRKFPDEILLFSTTLIIFICVYVIFTFYIYHIHMKIYDQIRENFIYYENFNNSNDTIQNSKNIFPKK